MPSPEKLKCKLLMPDADGDRRMDRDNTICLFHHSSNGEGITNDHVWSFFYIIFTFFV